MKVLESPYKFESFVDFLNSLANLKQRVAASIEFEFENQKYSIIPSHTSSADDSNLVTSNSRSLSDVVRFEITNQDFQTYGDLLIGKINDSKILAISRFETDLNIEALKVLVDFLEFEFSQMSALKVIKKSSANSYEFKSLNLERSFSTLSDLIEFTSEYSVEKSVIPIKEGFSEKLSFPILTAGPSISILEKVYVADAVANGWNTHHSDYLNFFENEFANFVGAKYAMATSSCTGALHLSLLALGVGPGDEVIVPDITWVATASAVRYVGATPIFADVNQFDWTLDIEKLPSLVTPRTKAIIPVHLYGYGVDMQGIKSFADSKGLKIIEDAAPAIGTLISSKFAGTFGDLGCYSFQGAKLLVTGEGGMLVTDSQELFNRAKKIQDHGRKPGTFWIEELGHKYKMNNFTAALGSAQIQRANLQIQKKRLINERYTEGLNNISGIRFQKESLNTKSICWMTSFVLEKQARVSRDELIQKLKSVGVDSRPVFPAISQYKIWGYESKVNEVSKFIGDNGINLPSGVGLSNSAIDYVINQISKILN